MVRVTSWRRRRAQARVADAAAPGSASAELGRGLRRAAAGLVLAGSVQTVAAVVVTGPAYPAWFRYGAFPVALALVVVGCRDVVADVAARAWLRAICVGTAALSLAASAAVTGRPTGGVNVVEPFVGLGAFAVGFAGWSGLWPFAVLLLVVHRAGLVLARTGSPGEHLGMLVWEAGSLAASYIGSRAVARFAARLDEADQELSGELERHALLDLATAADGERARLLHDVAVETLTAIGRGTEHGSRELRRRCAAEAAHLRGAAPSWLHDQPDVRDALEGVVARHRQRGLTIDLTGPPEDVTPPPQPALTALTGALQESLTNVARHSGISSCAVEWAVHAAATGDLHVVTIVDEGRGFDPRRVDHRLGVSQSIRRRMEQAGGSVRITSRPGAGTCIVLRWPEQP